MTEDFGPEYGAPEQEQGQATTETASSQEETGAWWESLPDDLKSEPTVQRYKSTEDAIRGLVNANKLIGKKRIAMPTPDAPKEEWDEFYMAIGRPESPDGYKINIEDSDEDILNEFKRLAHEKGFTQQQIEGIEEFWEGFRQKTAEKIEQQIEQLKETALAELQKEWGNNFDSELETAKKAVETLCDDEQKQLLNAGLGNDPRVIRLFNRIGKMLGEDKLSSVIGKGGFTIDAKSELAKLKNDPKFIKALQDSMNPEHDEAVKKFKRLHEIAFGE